MIHLRNDSDHLGPHMNVFNTLCQEMSEIAAGMPLVQLAEKVLLTKSKDSARGNLFIDTGICSDRSTKRSGKHGGVAEPNILIGTSDPQFLEAMLGLTRMLDHACPPELKGKVFVDAEREKLFAGQIHPLNRLEAFRAALTNENHLVDCHGDSQNDERANFSGVITYSKWFLLSDCQWWRLTLIGYSRKSVGGFLRRKQLYEPLVERIADFYERMPPARKSILPSLLAFEDDARRIVPHTNKSVFYSIYVHCLRQLQESLSLSVWHVTALITNTVVSETPEYFRAVSIGMMTSVGTELHYLRSLGPIDLALAFYDRVFTLKEKDFKKQKKVPGQRHQPHYNKRQPEATVILSIVNFFRLYKAMDHIEGNLPKDSYFFSLSVALLQDSHLATGVYGAGGLTAQHLLHIGCMSGIFPAALMEHAEIGVNTKCYSYLAKVEKLSNHREDTRQLLACTCSRLNISAFIAENLICKFVQSQAGQPICIYRDSLYREQLLYSLASDGTLNVVSRTGSSCSVPTLAKSCSPLESNHAIPLVEVPISYWDSKVGRGRFNPMKNGTRNAWRASQGLPETGPKKKRKSIDLLPLTTVVPRKRTKRIVGSIDPRPLRTVGPKKRTRIQITVPSKWRTTSRSTSSPPVPVPSGEQSDPIETCGTKGSKVLGLEEQPVSCIHRRDIRGSKVLDLEERVPVKFAMSPNGQAGFVCPSSYDGLNLDEVDFRLFDPYVENVEDPLMLHPILELEYGMSVELVQERTSEASISWSEDHNKRRKVRGFLRRPRISATVLDEWGALPLRKMGLIALGVSEGHGNLVRHHSLFHQVGKKRTTMHAGCILVKQEVPTADSTLWYPSSKICPFLLAAYFPLSVVGPDGKRYHDSKANASKYCFIQAILAGGAEFVRDELMGRYLRREEIQRVLFDPSIAKCKNELPKQPIAIVMKENDGTGFFSFVDSNGECVGPKLAVDKF